MAINQQADGNIVYGEERIDENPHMLYNLLVAERGVEFAENHQNAVEIAYQLYDTFGLNSRGESAYPEYFGGMYIDSDGNLNILTVDSFTQDARAIIPLSNKLVYTPEIIMI